jgi:hypothetical protein
MGVKAGPRIVTNGLIFDLDAAVSRSYSGSGLTANGLIGGIGGTLVNGVGFTSSNNGSFIFDGSNDYLEIPLSGTGISCLFNNFSISFIARTFLSFTTSNESTTGIFGTGGKRYIIEPRYAEMANAGGWGVALGTNAIEVVEHTAGHMPVLLSYAASITGFNHFTMVSNDKTPSVYINGNLVRTGLTSSKNLTTFYLDTNLGGYIYGYNSCNILNYSIYNRVLTQQEILQNYNATKGRYI